MILNAGVTVTQQGWKMHGVHYYHRFYWINIYFRGKWFLVNLGWYSDNFSGTDSIKMISFVKANTKDKMNRTIFTQTNTNWVHWCCVTITVFKNSYNSLNFSRFLDQLPFSVLESYILYVVVDIVVWLVWGAAISKDVIRKEKHTVDIRTTNLLLTINKIHLHFCIYVTWSQ